MALVDDQKVVQAFTAHGPDKTFGECVGPWRPYGRLDHPGTDVGEHAVERRGELRVAVTDQEPDRGGPLAQIHQQIACLLRDPRPAGMTGNAEDVHAPGADFHHEELIRTADAAGRCRRGRNRTRAGHVPARGGTAANSDSRVVVSASDRQRRGSGGPCPPPRGIRAGPLRLEYGGNPIAGCPQPAAGPEHGCRRRPADVRACAGRSNARRPADDATPTASLVSRADTRVAHAAAAGRARRTAPDPTKITSGAWPGGATRQPRDAAPESRRPSRPPDRPSRISHPNTRTITT
jgi:hypothetical protein